MKVSRTVREYITKEVYKKVKARYATDREIVNQQTTKLNDFLRNLAKSLNIIAEEEVNKFLQENPEYKRASDHNIVSYYPQIIQAVNRTHKDSPYNWMIKANEETDDIVENIIVTLELGGTKADLERMLDEI